MLKIASLFICLIILHLLQTASAARIAMNDGAFAPGPMDLVTSESSLSMTEATVHLTVGREKVSVRSRFSFVNEGKEALTYPVAVAELALGVGNDQKSAYIDLPGDLQISLPEHQPRDGEIIINDSASQVKTMQISEQVSIDPFTALTSFPAWKTATDNSSRHPLAWTVVHLSVAPGESVTYSRSYTVDTGFTDIDFPKHIFLYSIAPAGAWKGNIRLFRCTLEFVDGLGPKDLIWPSMERDGAMYPLIHDWQRVSDSSIKLEWKDFDPRVDAKKRHIAVVYRMAETSSEPAFVESTPAPEHATAAPAAAAPPQSAGTRYDLVIVNVKVPASQGVYDLSQDPGIKVLLDAGWEPLGGANYQTFNPQNLVITMRRPRQ